MRLLGVLVALVLGAPISSGTASGAATPSPVRPSTAVPTAEPTPIVSDADLTALRTRALLFPVPAVSPATVADTFDDRRGAGRHEALDIAAPRDAAVVAVDDATVVKLFRSVPGGLTVYLFDRDRRFGYYYAHLERYADDLREQTTVARGQVIGYVGTSGNAPPDHPHLHFAIFKLEPEPHWWNGTAIDPYPLWAPPERDE